MSEDVEVGELKGVDFKEKALLLGVKYGEEGREGWLALDREDLQILVKLLSRPVLDVTEWPVGETILTPAESSEALYLLHSWAVAAEDYMRRRGL